MHPWCSSLTSEYVGVAFDVGLQPTDGSYKSRYQGFGEQISWIGRIKRAVFATEAKSGGYTVRKRYRKIRGLLLN